MFSFKRLTTGPGVACLVIGAMAGLLVATYLAPRFGWSMSESDGLIWGLVAGSTLAHAPDFIAAGAKLTNRENRVLNLGVGLLGMLLLIAVLIGVVILAGQILRACNWTAGTWPGLHQAQC